MPADGGFFQDKNSLLYANATWEDLKDTHVGRQVETWLDDIRRDRDSLKKQIDLIMKRQAAKLAQLQKDMEREID